MQSFPTTGGIVLCGGRSSRMGRPKAWLPVGGEVMLQRVVRIVREVVEPVVVVAAPGQDLPELPADVMIARDDVEGRGPLQGLASGMQALAGRVEIAFLTSCDVPLLRPAFIGRVVSLLLSVPEADAAVPHVDGRLHPLAAAYRVGVLKSVLQLLSENRLRATGLFELLSTRAIEAHDLENVDPKLESLQNVNTPEEYDRAIERLNAR